MRTSHAVSLADAADHLIWDQACQSEKKADCSRGFARRAFARGCI